MPVELSTRRGGKKDRGRLRGGASNGFSPEFGSGSGGGEKISKAEKKQRRKKKKTRMTVRAARARWEKDADWQTGVYSRTRKEPK